MLGIERRFWIITNFIKNIPPIEADSCCVSLEIFCSYGTRKCYYRVHKSPQIRRILNHLNQIQMLIFFMIHFNIMYPVI
jgi:hypothetical protein